jgi:hypothetical protein
MPTKILNYFSHHAIAILALICSLLALAGASYAAITLPNNSVGTQQIKSGAVGGRQIQDGAVTPAKLNHTAIGGSVRMWARVNLAGQLTSSNPRARLVGWNVAPGAFYKGGVLNWRQRVPKDCFSMATVDSYPLPGYASTQTVTTPGKDFGTQVRVALSAAEAVDVAVIC